MIRACGARCRFSHSDLGEHAVPPCRCPLSTGFGFGDGIRRSQHRKGSFGQCYRHLGRSEFLAFTGKPIVAATAD